ncbi:8919_t:CDS:2, partial [Gigaspora rosea]
NNLSKSRIDQIWVSENLVTGLKKSTIEDMFSYTSSDHQGSNQQDEYSCTKKPQKKIGKIMLKIESISG